MERLTLPDAAWRHRAGLAELAALLGEGQARFVGGAVRDTLLGLPVADVDIATALEPAEVMARLKAGGLRVVPTGIAHGTVTAVLPDGPIEVTTLRHDLETDGRHAVVAFTADWQADAARRDFTMNALYADPSTGAVVDYFDGLADLRAGRVRFIGDPLERIAEDHLRILRFFRFHARFGDVPDPAGLAACTARANDLMALSRERIAAELLKLLVAKGAVETIALMVDRGILAPVLPEIEAAGVARLAALAAREGEAGIAPDAIRRLAALLPADAKVTDLIGARLKLSNADRKRLNAAVEPLATMPWRALGYRLGITGAIDRLLLSDRRDAPADAAALAGWTPPQLPLSGGAIVARGVAKGPEVARLLRAIEQQWIDEDFPDAARVEAIADQLVGAWLRSTSKA
ncbi:CCA tRNA nucleotidyltransferase [Sphingomonas koreensis]|nr:CCA tRNA nucleotidyltransferase [Sphingomonas koreensis]